MDRHLQWQKSTRSNSQGNCVEVATPPDMVMVRDSKDRSGPVLAFGAREWLAFIDGVKQGEFDR
jgi:predicted secreted Zn-dependent protease